MKTHTTQTITVYDLVKANPVTPLSPPSKAWQRHPWPSIDASASASLRATGLRPGLVARPFGRPPQ
jgi:hypothetical protein